MRRSQPRLTRERRVDEADRRLRREHHVADATAGRPGGIVNVATEAVPATNPSKIRLTVTDTGPGMSRQQLERAFDDFYTTKPGGTGLGLSIVRRLVMDLNGALRIETEPGAGTRVILEFPVADSDSPGLEA